MISFDEFRTGKTSSSNNLSSFDSYRTRYKKEEEEPKKSIFESVTSKTSEIQQQPSRLESMVGDVYTPQTQEIQSTSNLTGGRLGATSLTQPEIKKPSAFDRADSWFSSFGNYLANTVGKGVIEPIPGIGFSAIKEQTKKTPDISVKDALYKVVLPSLIDYGVQLGKGVVEYLPKAVFTLADPAVRLVTGKSPSITFKNPLANNPYFDFSPAQKDYMNKVINDNEYSSLANLFKTLTEENITVSSSWKDAEDQVAQGVDPKEAYVGATVATIIDAAILSGLAYGSVMKTRTREIKPYEKTPVSESTKQEARQALGINKGATESEIRKAYINKARIYHPDKAGTGNEELFKQVNSAYNVLTGKEVKVYRANEMIKNYVENEAIRQSAIVDNAKISKGYIDGSLNDISAKVNRSITGDPNISTPLGNKILTLKNNPSLVDSPGKLFSKISEILKSDKAFKPEMLDVENGLGSTIRNMFIQLKEDPSFTKLMEAKGLGVYTPTVEVELPKQAKIAPKTTEVVQTPKIPPIVPKTGQIMPKTAIVEPFKPFNPNTASEIEQNNALQKSKIGTGNYQVGEIYTQKIGENQRPVLITKVNPDRSVEGFYVGAVSPTEKSFGIGLKSLQSAKWNNPVRELQVPSFGQEVMDKMVTKVFGIEKPVSEEIEPLIQEAKKYKSAEEFVKAVQNESNISQQGRLQQIPLNKIKGSDYPELDMALKSGKLSLKDAQDLLPDNEINMANSKVSMPIEVVKNSDGTYSLQAGNHRVAQQLVNGEKTIFANIVNEKGFSTKSQLTDIWNKTQEVKPVEKEYTLEAIKETKEKEVIRKIGKEEIEIQKPLFTKTNLKTLLQNNPEFATNPKLKVVVKKDKYGFDKKALQFKGENSEFTIYTEALGLVDINLKIGQIINVKPETLKPKGQELRVKKYTPQPTGEPKEEIIGLSAKSWQVNMAKEPTVPKTINKTTILTYASNAFNVPIKSKATAKWKKAGVYYPKSQIVRMKKWGELSIMTHEISHHIDRVLRKTLGRNWYRPTPQITHELAGLDYDQEKRRTEEGFAEYMRHKLTTGLEKEKAPYFDKFFDDFLLKNPKLKGQLDKLKEMLDTWHGQGSENRIIQHIDWKGEHTKAQGLKLKAQKAWKFVNEKFNDEFYVPQKITKEIEKVIGRKLTPSKNPATMMEYSKSKAGAIARTFVLKNAIDEYGNVVGPSLSEILKSVKIDITDKMQILKPLKKEQMKKFVSYAVAKRALVLEKRGIESGFDKDDINFVIEKYKDEGWDDAVKGMTQWSNHFVDWLVRAGGLSPETGMKMKMMNPIYIPFKRAFIESAEVIKGGAGYVDTSTGVKGIKGSGRPVINPLESMIAQSRELIAKAQKIRIAKLFVDLATEEGVGGFITEVPAPMKATTFSSSQIKDYVETITGDMMAEDMDDMLTVFTQDFKYNGKENIVSIWKNGKQKFYEIHPDLYESFKGIDPLKLGPISKLLAPFSRMLRLGATGLKVSFGLARNPFRDALSYAVFSKRKGATIFDPIKGIYKDITTKPGEATYRFKALGGSMSGQIGLDRASTMSTYDEMLATRLGKKGKALLVVKHPITALRDLLSITEMGPRSAELESMYKKYTSPEWKQKHPDWNEEDAFVQAFNDAQDVTVNFTKSGKWAKQLNEVTAFFNVSIRGPEKLYRSFRERPIATFIKGLLWLTGIAVGSWYLNKDKEWYKNLPPSYRYNNLFFEIPKVGIVRLPIPFELGTIFMAMPQATLDTIKDKSSKYYKGLLQIAKSQVPNPTPSMFQPLIDVVSNKNYLGAPIESEGMQYLYPTERKREYTSKLSMALSKGLDKIGIQTSPIMLDYIIDSYSGGFTKQFKISGDELSNYPVLSDLMLNNPDYPRQQLNEFFSQYELLKQKKSSEVITKDELNKLDEFNEFYDTYKSVSDSLKQNTEDNDKQKIKENNKQLSNELNKLLSSDYKSNKGLLNEVYTLSKPRTMDKQGDEYTESEYDYNQRIKDGKKMLKNIGIDTEEEAIDLLNQYYSLPENYVKNPDNKARNKRYDMLDQYFP